MTLRDTISCYFHATALTISPLFYYTWILLHFIYSYKNSHLLVVQSSSSPVHAADWDIQDKMLKGPLSVNMKHLSLSLSHALRT